VKSIMRESLLEGLRGHKAKSPELKATDETMPFRHTHTAAEKPGNGIDLSLDPGVTPGQWDDG